MWALQEGNTDIGNKMQHRNMQDHNLHGTAEQNSSRKCQNAWARGSGSWPVSRESGRGELKGKWGQSFRLCKFMNYKLSLAVMCSGQDANYGSINDQFPPRILKTWRVLRPLITEVRKRERISLQPTSSVASWVSGVMRILNWKAMAISIWFSVYIYMYSFTDYSVLCYVIFLLFLEKNSFTFQINIYHRKHMIN